MSKEYQFRGKTYIVTKNKKQKFGCKNCAFMKETAAVCKKFLDSTNAPDCGGSDIIFAEKQQSVVGFCPESSWGVKPTDKTEEIRSDRVIADKRSASSTWSFQLNMDNGYRPASISVTASKTAENCKFTAAILPDTERFIVCLVENDKLAPSDSPKQHKTRESAEKEAERLCKLHHQEFVVLQIVSAVKPQEPKKEVFA